MGEVFHAFQHLNDTLKLGLSGEQLQRAEAGFKSRFAKVSNPSPELARVHADPDALSEQFEFVTVLQPRARKMPIAEIRTLADNAVRTNLSGVKLGSVRLDPAKVATGHIGATRIDATRIDASRIDSSKINPRKL